MNISQDAEMRRGSDSDPARRASPRTGRVNVTLHRFSTHPTPGDLTWNDLGTLWGLLRAESLVDVFFHDGIIRDIKAFAACAADPAVWFYAAKRDGEFIGIGIINNFSSSGNTAYAHLASFSGGRDGSFAEAGRLWFRLLRDGGGIDTLIAVLPGCYRGARRWSESFGFVERMRLPGALRLIRDSGIRVTDAVVYQLNLNSEE